MIRLTRLNHQEITINAEIIEHIESTPDTLIKLTNGQSIMVRETVDEVVALVIGYKRRILGVAEAFHPEVSAEKLKTKLLKTEP